jgi:hypothetical protein
VLCDDGLSRAYALFCKPKESGGDSVAETRRILAQMEVCGVWVGEGYCWFFLGGWW